MCLWRKLGHSHPLLYAMQDVVAIKIFADPAGFANEERAYGIKALAEVVGQTPTFSNNEDRGMMMSNGLPFPPYLSLIHI